MRQYTEDELIIPEGPFKDERYRLYRQPFVGLLLDAIDSGNWTRFAITGCVQGGKSLFGFVNPAGYHLFERKQNVILGVPNTNVIGRDKWNNEIKPTIEASRYAGLMPIRGVGSQGGWGNEVAFTHGSRLKFMTGTGGDENRSSYTAPVVICTECDKMDISGEISREADPVTQLCARSGAWDRLDRRLYLECTVSHTKGRIWQEYINGTASRIACPCPYCRKYVTPERDSIRGWEEAANEIEAEDLSYFACPACEHKLTEDDREVMNQDAVLVHKGQTVDKTGEITGDLPPTWTLGFRWNAWNNMFWSTATIGAEEWRAQHAEDEESAEKERSQYAWATPWDPPEIDMTPLDPEKLKSRNSGRLTQGQLPKDAGRLTMGVDLHKKFGCWTLLAWRPGGKSHIVDYGEFGITTQLTVDEATLIALRKFRKMVLGGWADSSGAIVTPAQVWVDSAYEESQQAVYGFCLESAAIEEGAERFRPCKGYGAAQQKDRFYKAPTKVTKTNRIIGEGYWLGFLDTPHKTLGRVKLVHVNADHWKSQVHQRLSIPPEADGAMTIWQHSLSPNEHKRFVQQLLAERAMMKPMPGREPALVMEQIRDANHWLDSTALATAAGHICGERLAKPEKTEDSEESWFARQKRKATGRGNKRRA